MALNGKFTLNGAHYSPFQLYGVGTFMAFSGKGDCRNKSACAIKSNIGPLPIGKYWIVERGTGGLGSWFRTQSLDWYNRYYNGAEFGRDEWFALYRDDWSIDDYTWINGVKRGLFRLHPGRISEGCLTIAHNADYGYIRNALMETTPIEVPCAGYLMARGWIEVVENGFKNSCP